MERERGGEGGGCGGVGGGGGNRLGVGEGEGGMALPAADCRRGNNRQRIERQQKSSLLFMYCVCYNTTLFSLKTVM